MVMALTIAVLVAGSVYMILQRGMVRIIFGMSLFGHASNLTLLATGVGAWRGEPLLGNETTAGAGAAEQMADPLPQAFVLTAIVIAMATTTILLMLASLGKDDDTMDNPTGVAGTYDLMRLSPSALSTAGRTARLNPNKMNNTEGAPRA